MRRSWFLLVLIVAMVLGSAPAWAVRPLEVKIDGWAELPETPVELTSGDTGVWVRRLQRSLDQAGFRSGGVDGRFGGDTRGAVWAFQKYHGLERTGVFRRQDWKLLEEKVVAPGPAPEADRIEVDLGRQILFVIRSGEAVAVLGVSSANGDLYESYTGRMVTARTPEGSFTFSRGRQGWWESYLGHLYSPYYFRGGYAIHGSNSVPPYEASHGCVRVRLGDMDFLRQRVDLGSRVYLYGKRYSRAEVVPTA